MHVTQVLAAPPAEIAVEVEAACKGVPGAEAGRVLAAVRSADGLDATALRDLAIGEAAALIPAEPGYSKVAARLLGGRIRDEAAAAGVRTFAESVAAAHREGLLADDLAAFVAANAAALDALIDEGSGGVGGRPHPKGAVAGADDRFEYFGLRTVYDRYLLRHPRSRLVLERPQHFFLRVACGLVFPGGVGPGGVGGRPPTGDTDPGGVGPGGVGGRPPTGDMEAVDEAAELYALLSTLSYLPSSPTLFNSGARRPQLSSCFLLDSPRDELESIYDRYGQVARLSKYAGGIGISWTRVRSRGSLIRGTNGHSNGIVPWLRTLDSSVAAVNQGGRRKGAACVYLEPWHADVEEFLELRDNTGEDARRTHNLNLANWIPDEFMRRVEADAAWSLFDPKEVPELVDLWGDEFDETYRAAERAGRFVRQVPARKLYGRMMRTLAETGNGWMTFKDAANRACNQTAEPGRVVHLSNLCTEILEVTGDGEAAVCNLGSVNLAAHVGPSGVDWERLRSTVRTAVRFLDRTIDRGFYPTPEAEKANRRWRPVGLGVMGLADVFFTLRLPFDSDEARELSTRIAEEIALAAYNASADLAAAHGPLPAYDATRTARGLLHLDHFPDAAPSRPAGWDALRARVAEVGLRNSLLVAIAPTATIASIAGCYECIEPQVSNLFKRETLSGEFLQINRYLVEDLKSLGLWTPAVREAVKKANGSVQGLVDLPEEMLSLYRTAWELPQKALIDLAAARTPYIDQSQSLNLFMETPTIGKLSSMYAYAWRAGLKTTYYLRSRPATRIAQTTVAAAVCSLENPETCEACQ
ncbi:ribonucleoside-diphosphate reductase alpha chain [Actinomadura mexicana]|uniref:Ribonucleoside-diphosphate reductase n=1 Tax=Actinomadura mexicana TaxID=134959 RepID=A0A238VRH3_9ACTN|nr:ribonucleoside-diphosphate reductase alpha chain [Actinomadura mexicana]